MNCKAFIRLISRQIDQGLSAEEERALSHHLGICAECARTAGLLRTNRALLGSLPQTRPSPRVKNEVLAAWARDRLTGAPGSGLLRRLLPVQPQTLWRLASVGTLVLVCLTLFAASHSPAPNSAKQVAKSPAPVTTSPGSDLVAFDVTAPFDGRTARFTPVGEPFLFSNRPDAGDLLVPAYLPQGVRLDQLALKSDNRSGRIVQAELVFRGEQQMVLRLHEVRTAQVDGRPADLVDAQSITINGRDWWYGKRQVQENRLVQVLSGQMGQVAVGLEADYPISELVRMVASLQ